MAKMDRSARTAAGPAASRQRTTLGILRHNEEWLKKLPNVHHIGMSTKLRKCRNTGRPAITIYVTKKKAEKGGGKVPRRLTAKIGGVSRSIQTDVCELPGVPRLFNMRGGERIITSDMETGTAGLVFSHNGRNYCMTNAHVVTDPGDAGSHPIAVPPPVGGGGTVVRRDDLPFDQVINSDAALILLNTAVDSWMFYNSEAILRGFVDQLSIGQICFYTTLSPSGAGHSTFRCQLVAIVDGSAPMQVEDSMLTYGSFYRFSVLNGSPIGGHSGSLLYTEQPNGLFGAGLAFGGIEGEEIWAFPARRCFDRMMVFFDG